MNTGMLTKAIGFICCAMAFTAILSGCVDETSSVEPQPEFEVVGTDEYMEVINHLDDNVLEFVIGPFDMAADAGHLRLPIQKTEVPFDFYGHGFEWEIRTADGQKLPDGLLHHVNLIDIDSRELFSPVARRIVAAGRETSNVQLPKVAGMPVEEGHRLWIVSMFGNPTGQDYSGAYLHLKVEYSLPGEGIIPTMEVYPFYLDVTGFVGPKDFPVPPGESEKSHVASPGADGKILGIGGHLHDYATELRLEDVTTGETVWTGEPVVNDDGRTIGVSRNLLLAELGKEIHADHEYRIVVVHDNPTDELAPDGGMGAIGGIMTVSSDDAWPELDPNHPDYVKDLENTLLEPERMAAHGHGGHGDHSGMGGEEHESGMSGDHEHEPNTPAEHEH